VVDQREETVTFLRGEVENERSKRARFAAHVGRSMTQEAFARYCARSEENERELVAALAALGIHDA